jgi:hypothetical protein
MSRIRIALVIAAAGISLAACSTANKPAPPPSHPAAVATTTTSSPPSPAATTSSPASAADLAGAWSGQYGGSYQGTFTLHWTQSGSKLSGTITLSNPAGQTSINGNVNGSAITFGTVGSEAITYSGSVSGSSMSGSWKAAAMSGTWSASKS